MPTNRWQFVHNKSKPTIAKMATSNNEANQSVPLDANIQDEGSMSSTGLSDADLVKIIQQCEKENEDVLMSQQCQKEITNCDGSTSKMLTKQMVAKKSSPQVSLFHQCKIENITINIHK